MTNLQKVSQEVLELELDYDQVILDFEQYGHINQVLEVESESFEFSIIVEVNAANYGEFDLPPERRAFVDKIKEQLKTVR